MELRHLSQGMELPDLRVAPKRIATAADKKSVRAGVQRRAAMRPVNSRGGEAEKATGLPRWLKLCPRREERFFFFFCVCVEAIKAL